TQIGQLTKLITNLSKDYAGNTVDNPIKEAYKAVGEKFEKTEEKKTEEREKDEIELRQFQTWFRQLGLTLEEAYIEFMGELEVYYEEEKAQVEVCTEYLQRKLPPKQKDPGTFTVPVCFGNV
ncbi:hypothetical protein A2U01_0061109, partial [Trifolium medium]|nr:hypothetical protein [Trifolium medium]